MKLTKILLVLVSAVLIGGCNLNFLTAKKVDTLTESPDVTLVGQLVKSGEGYFLTKDDGSNVDLDTREVDLGKYEATAVVVIGQYSGTTLFVSKIRSR